MKPVDDKKPVVMKAVIRDQEGKKKVELKAHKMETIKYVEKKLFDKGLHRLERHPADGLWLRQPPPKSGHGGKYTWEGPEVEVESELEAAPPALDEKDPNYVDEEEEEKILKGEETEVPGSVVGEVEVARAVEGRVGVARVEVDAPLKGV